MGKYDCLFEPLQVGSIQLKNRIVLEPMGIHSHRRVNADGSFTEDGIAYYEIIAKGGTGLIITSAMPVNSAFDLSKGSKAAMDLAGEEFIENTRKLTERLHSYGAKIFMQLSAGAGRVQPRFIADGEPVAPSDGLPNFWNPSITHRALTRRRSSSISAASARPHARRRKAAWTVWRSMRCTRAICWISSRWRSATSGPTNTAAAWKAASCLRKRLWRPSRKAAVRTTRFPSGTACAP